MLPAIDGLCQRTVSNVSTTDWGSVSFQLGDVFVNVAFPSSLSGVTGGVAELQGRVLEGISKSETQFQFSFRGGATLTVDLNPQNDHGPEAIVFGFPGGADVVVV